MKIPAHYFRKLLLIIIYTAHLTMFPDTSNITASANILKKLEAKFSQSQIYIKYKHYRGSWVKRLLSNLLQKSTTNAVLVVFDEQEDKFYLYDHVYAKNYNKEFRHCICISDNNSYTYLSSLSDVHENDFIIVMCQRAISGDPIAQF